ncbi:hypothetical protein Rs2_21314 [Raphanus sativus]|nr:hypothetical protein Rs2_21314 [Raphanus sativus]
MGCAQSRVDNEEAVARCKDRRNVIKEAVTASKAFAAGHFAYAIALKNTGAALSDYGHGESDQTLDAALEQSHFEKGDDRETTSPVVVSASPGAWDYFFMPENVPGGNLEDMRMGNNHHFQFNDEEEEDGRSGLNAVEEIEHSNTAPPDFRRAVAAAKTTTAASSVNLMKILDEIDDRFLKASECAQEVSKMLEATRLHYHSNFADNRGYVDHSARVMRVITWNKSLRGISNGEGGKDDQESDEHETHATVLDKLLAWEKKLYDEVKQGEIMKIEYQKKVSLLNRHKKRGASAETVEKTKAAVSHLHTRYIVDMQSMDSTVSEVNRLRDDQLYPRLVSLVEGMAKMWTNMCIQHDTQLKIVGELKSLEISTSQKETTKQHHQQTRQFCTVLEEWHVQFESLVTHQKQYINSLNTWLKLNLIPIESSLKEKVSSPPRPQRPPIQALLHSWHDRLEKLPDEVAKSAISSFAAVVKTILLHQEEEMKLKERCEETRREFIRKKQGFEEWYQKHLQKRGPTTAEEGGDGDDDHVTERRIVVETLKKRLEDEEEAHQRHCVQVREKSLNSLKIRLPEIFRALSDYAHACADSYEKLRVISQTQKGNVSS